jgi:hypothetical protein
MSHRTLVFQDIPLGDWLATIQVATVRGKPAPIGWMAVHSDGETSVIRLSDGSVSSTGHVGLPTHRDLVELVWSWVETHCPTMEEAMLRWVAPRLAGVR